MTQIHEPPRTYFEAMEVLNARRNGAEMPEWIVLKALELTGDYRPERRYQDRRFVPLFQPA